FFIIFIFVIVTVISSSSSSCSLAAAFMANFIQPRSQRAIRETCDSCGATFPAKAYLSNHIRQSHKKHAAPIKDQILLTLPKKFTWGRARERAPEFYMKPEPKS